jgi:hypothetical protein
MLFLRDTPGHSLQPLRAKELPPMFESCCAPQEGLKGVTRQKLVPRPQWAEGVLQEGGGHCSPEDQG